SPSSIVIDPVGGYDAYDEAKMLRLVKPYTYLKGDTTYTLTDTLCWRCRNPIVSRKPWGVVVRAEAHRHGARCGSCGAVNPGVLLARRRGRRPPARELMVL
ncbi:MAG: hypothetical protein GXO09_02190, partial [Crenarchaeota archaeon]|nr:hypothetical protein [Thermoproteota archaeon]